MNVHYSLISAIHCGNLERVRELVDSYGLSYSQAWSEGYNLLCEAIKNQHIEIAKLLLIRDAKVNSTNQNPSNTPLHLTSMNGNIEIVEMLLNRDADIDARNAYGSTVLHSAIHKEKIEIIKLLLTRRADVNARDNNDMTPLIVASMKRCLKIIAELLRYGVDVNSTSHLTRKKRNFFAGYTALHYAVQRGSEEIVKLLLKNSADVNIVATDGITPLHIAAEEGYVHIAEDLLNHGAYTHFAYISTKREGYTPLHLACEHCNVEIIKLLLSRNANVNANTKNNLTPLHIVTKNGHVRVVKLLLEHGAKVDAQDKDGNTILHLAVKEGSLMIIKNVLKYSPDINDKSNKNSLNIAIQGFGANCKKIVETLLQYDFTVNLEDVNNNNPELLHSAVERGYLKIVEDLLKRGIDVNILYKKDYTPLHSAVKNKQEEVTNLLINSGACINAKDGNKKTPIFCAIENIDLKITKLLLINGANVDSPELLNTAVKRECREIIEILLQHDADINASDEYGRTALHFVALDEKNGHFFELGRELFDTYVYKSIYKEVNIHAKREISELLLNKGTNVNAKTKNGLTTLHIATYNGYTKIVEVLLEYNADVNLAIQDDLTSLHLAVIINHEKIVEILLKYGAEYNSRARENITPLHIATRNGYTKIIEILLQRGADINASDEYGITALHLAILEEKNFFWNNDKYYFRCKYVCYKEINIHTKREISELLLNKGANVNAKTKNDITTLHIAIYNGYTKIVEVLLQHDADINASDEYGRTALHFVVLDEKNGHFFELERELFDTYVCKSIYKEINIHAKREISELLLNKGANVNAKTKNGITTLHIATYNGYTKIVEALLKYEADVNSATKNYHITPLHVAANRNREKIMEILLKYGAKYDCRTKTGLTPLHAAARNDYSKIVEILLKFDSEVDFRDIYGETALHMACIRRNSTRDNIKIVNALLEYDSDINITNIDNYTPLEYAMMIIDSYLSRNTFYLNFDTRDKIINYRKILKRHIVKIKTVGLNISEKNLLLIRNDDEINNFPNECKAEIEIMKGKKINNSHVSFHDILTKNINQLVIYRIRI